MGLLEHRVFPLSTAGAAVLGPIGRWASAAQAGTRPSPAQLWVLAGPCHRKGPSRARFLFLATQPHAEPTDGAGI